MSCSINKEDLIAFIYNELDENKTKILKQHIKTCRECKKESDLLIHERNILKKWKVESPKMEFVFVEEKQSIISKIKEYFRPQSLKPIRIGYILAGVAAAVMIVLSLVNFEFNYDDSGVTISTGIFGKGKEDKVENEFLEKLMQNQQETINLILHVVAASEERIKQERDIILAQLVQEIQRQRESDMLFVEENIERFSTVTADKFRENDELIGRLVYLAEENLMK